MFKVMNGEADDEWRETEGGGLSAFIHLPTQSGKFFFTSIIT